MESNCFSSYWLTADLCLIEQQALLAGVIITASAATKTVVILYDGVNANGRKIGEYRVAADSSEVIKFPEPIFLIYGLYVDVDDNVTGVQVFYRPLGKTKTEIVE